MGRPTKYKPEYCEAAYKLCLLLGATDKELSEYFDVCIQTIHTWKAQYPDFLEAIKSGKEGADANVASRLYRRAMGYEHEAVKIVADAKTGTEHVVPYIEKFPPDTTACIFWLKNRQPRHWRDQKHIQHEHTATKGELEEELRSIGLEPDELWQSLH